MAHFAESEYLASNKLIKTSIYPINTLDFSSHIMSCLLCLMDNPALDEYLTLALESANISQKVEQFQESKNKFRNYFKSSIKNILFNFFSSSWSFIIDVSMAIYVVITEGLILVGHLGVNRQRS